MVLIHLFLSPMEGQIDVEESQKCTGMGRPPEMRGGPLRDWQRLTHAADDRWEPLVTENETDVFFAHSSHQW